MFTSLPGAAKALLWVRILNQLGAYAMAFLAVFAGPELASTALATFGVAALISRWGGAFILDWLPPRIVVAIGLAATGLSLIALALAQTQVQVLVAVAVVGLAFEIYEPATQELVARVTEGDQRQEMYGLLGSSLVAAGAVAGLIAAVLLPIGVRWLVVVDALTCLSAAVVALLFLPRDGRQRPAPGVGKHWTPPAVLLRVTLAGTAFAVGYLAVVMFLPLTLLQRGAPAWVPGVALAGAAVLAPAALWATRGLLAGRPHRLVLGAGAVLLGLLALVMARAGDVVLTIGTYLAWTAVMGILVGRWQALVADVAPEADRPRWFAFHGSSWGVAQPAVPGLVALVGGIATAGSAAFLTAGLAFLLVPMVLRARRV